MEIGNNINSHTFWNKIHDTIWNPVDAIIMSLGNGKVWKPIQETILSDLFSIVELKTGMEHCMRMTAYNVIENKQW